MDSFAGLVAAKKLTTIKQNCKVKGIDVEHSSPETEQKIKERVEKDLRKREHEKNKREEKYGERERQREKLRSRIRDKYNIPEIKEEETTKSTKKKPKKKELREKDFYKYNKVMPDEKGKQLQEEEECGQSANFAEASEKLAEQTPKNGKECVIS